MFASPELTGTGRGRLLDQSERAIPAFTFSPDNTHERYSDHNIASSHITALIHQIGSEIGASVRASLSRSAEADSVFGANNEPTSPASSPSQLSATVIDASKLNLVLRSDVSAPPFFRGDNSDRCTIFEWEELMRVYLGKKDCSDSELVCEILNRLMGRAREITKVWMRNNSGTTDANAVFAILRQHFSESVSSGLPLADFYAIKPHASENSLDYWIRLNQAADVAEQSLSSEGRAMFNRSMELAVMFVQNCPDKDLSLVFKSKAVRSWTACEVQECLDEFLRERKAKKCHVKQNAMGISEESQESVNNNCRTNSHNSNSCEPEQAPSILEKTTLDRVLNMLEKALVNCRFKANGENSGKLESLVLKEVNTGLINDTSADDIESVYHYYCESAAKDKTVIFQNSLRTAQSEDLFYTSVLVQDKFEIQGMLDSGSMATTLCADIVPQLRDAGIVDEDFLSPSDVILVGCGGKQTKPEGICNLKLELYGFSFVVPVLVVDGQIDQLILGTNVLKPLIRQFKNNDGYWRVMSKPDNSCQSTNSQFLRLLSNLERWRGETIPDKIGTVKLKSAVTLKPLSEHLVWARLPPDSKFSIGSTVVIEPSTSRCVPRNTLVGRVISPLWGDGWLPVKIVNPTTAEITLRRNAKVADVFPCIALEDLESIKDVSTHQNVGALRSESSEGSLTAKSVVKGSSTSSDSKLTSLGLQGINVEDCQVTPFWKSKLVDLIAKYDTVFSRHSLDCGEARGFCHRIRLTDDRPFRLPYRRLSPAHYQKLRQTLDEMEEKEIIRKSSSEFASPLVLVWKKNGELRICTDFRWLNARTVKDAHPLPHQADVLAALGGNAFFSTMDLTSGYYNVPLHEEDKKYTAFSSPLGLHEYNRLPQGLCNSPATFMRMMLTIFGDQNFLSLLCYLDDVLVFAKSEEESLQRLEMVFQCLRAHNLKLSPSKCQFLRRSVKFLGHIVSEDGVATDPAKVEAIVNVTEQQLMENDGATPSTGKIRSFLGMIVYYQHFIEHCSTLAKPLFQLIAGQKKPRKGKGAKKSSQTRRLTPADWTIDCKQALQNLKAALINQALLAHPDFSKPFLLSVDASTSGLGAVLSQLQGGCDTARPIAFASKSLNHAQSKYPAHRLEFLAMKWAIHDKFSHWLRGHRFTVWTDNNPLKYILTKPKLDACEQRWVAKLAPFDFDIQYIPGAKNIVADALSREPFVKPRIMSRLTRTPYNVLLHEAETLNVDDVQDMFRLSCELPEANRSCEAVPCDVLHSQRSNQVFGDTAGRLSREEVSAVLQSHCRWKEGATLRAVCHVQHLEKLMVPGPNPLPVFSHEELLDEQCKDPVISRVKFFVERGRRPSRRERVHEPRETIHILKQWGKLTIRMGILYRLTKQPASKKRLFQYVVPAALRNQVMKGIHDEAGHQGQQRTLWLGRQRFYWNSMGRDIKESQQITYHTVPPNGQAERFNRTLGNMIRTLPPRSKAKWPQLLNTLAFAYNCTVHETTGFPPFFLMFGRTPHLPVDVMFESVLLDDETVDVDRYVQSLGEDLREAMSLAQMHAKRQQNKQAENYNRNCKGQSLDVGDRVLLVNKGERGKKKLADHWENTVYVVVSMNESLNIYSIRNPSTGRTKTVHRNLLMPVNFLPVPSWGESEQQGSYSTDSISRNMSMIDGQTDLCDDRTTQWVADLQDTPEVGQIEDTEDWCGEKGRGSLDFEDVAGTQQEDDQGEPVIGLDDTASTGSAENSQYQPHSLSCHGDTEHVEISSTTIGSRNNMVSTVPVEDTLPPNTLEPSSPSSKVTQTDRIRTRLGRFIKPVNRLIQTMSAQSLKQLLNSH
ncbi:hypothetical protein SRHO_G00177080 [Serrasalmus rhombeus]